MLVVAVVAIGDRQILFQFVLGVAPREVAVGLGEAHVAQGAHHARAGECLGQEQDLQGASWSRRQSTSCQKRTGLVRVIDAEDGDARLDPQIHDAFRLLFRCRACRR